MLNEQHIMNDILEKADRLNELCLARIDKIWNAEPGTPEAAELNILADAVEAYESLRWPIEPY